MREKGKGNIEKLIVKSEKLDMRMIQKMLLAATVMLSAAVSTNAQTSAGDSVMTHAKGNRLSVGAYGEVAYSRHFYSDNIYRYSNPSKYKNDPSNGRFDIPHAVIYLGYDFGKGWTFGTEIEFEHTGTGSAIELETDEGGEYEHEVEKAARWNWSNYGYRSRSPHGPTSAWDISSCPWV